jgi:hypothetical protein
MPARPVEAREAPHSAYGWHEELPSLDANRPLADRFTHPLEGAEERCAANRPIGGGATAGLRAGPDTSFTQLLTQSREPMDHSNDDGHFDGPWKSGLN